MLGGQLCQKALDGDGVLLTSGCDLRHCPGIPEVLCDVQRAKPAAGPWLSGEGFTRPDSPAGWTRWIEVIVHQSVFTAAAFCVFCMRLHFPKIAYAQAHPRIVSSCAK